MARFDIDAALAEANQGGKFDVDAGLQSATARASGADLPSPVQGFVTAMQGPLFGFLDEMTGAIQGAKSFATGGDYLPVYREGRDLIRGAEEQYRKDYPITAAITPLVAASPLMIGGPQLVLKAPAGASGAGVLARQVAGAGVTAAGYGAITSAGESENQDGNLLSDVLTGGLSSAATAGASVPVVNILAGIAGRGQRALPPGAIPGPLRIPGAERTDFATRKVAEQLIRDQPENIRKPMDRLLAYQRGMGNEARIVDLGGAQTHRTLDTLATLPGRTPEAARQAATQRAAGRGASIMRDAEKALGTQGAQYLQTLDDLELAAVQASKPYYDQIREVNIPVQGGLREVLQKANKYLGGADEYAATLGISGRGLREALEGVNVIGAGFQRTKTAVAPFQRFDALKQYLYDIERTYLRDGAKNQAAAITSIRRQLIDELDKLSPKDDAGRSIYKLARDAYAGPSQLRDAAELGRKAFDADKDFAIREAIKDLSPSEVAAMRVGLMQAIREKAGDQSGQTWLMNNWKNPATRERIQLAFGDQSGRFISALVKQSKLKMLESSVGGGSQTATRGANAEDLGIEAVKEAAAGMASVKAGDVPGAMNWIQKLVKQAYIPEPIRNEMGRILLMKGPEARAKLQQMVGILDLIARQQAKQAGTTGAFVGRQNPWLTGGNATNGDQ
jgi:hypothetical protein